MTVKHAENPVKFSAPLAFFLVAFSLGAMLGSMGVIGEVGVVLTSSSGVVAGLVTLVQIVNSTSENSLDVEEKRTLLDEKSDAKEK